jgi:hypothetical protein
MPGTQALQQANQLLVNMQANIFFNKLASFGIVPSSEKEAAAFFATAEKLVAQHPFETLGHQVKQACAVEGEVPQLSADGFSEDAHQTTEVIYANHPQLVKAAELLLREAFSNTVS